MIKARLWPKSGAAESRYFVRDRRIQRGHRRDAVGKAGAVFIWEAVRTEHGLVFATQLGGPLDAGNIRRAFRAICRAAGIGQNWSPRELRASFVSLMSHRGVSTEEIARLVGHSSTRTTEVIYRRQLRPVINTGATIMDRLFPGSGPIPDSGEAPAARSAS